MRVQILGAFEIAAAPDRVPSGGIARRVLAVLVAEANRPVHSERLADLVWPEAPLTTENTLQAHISRWRKALGAHRITYSPAGYTLVIGPRELDAFEFEERSREAALARSRGDVQDSIERCAAALDLWQGSPFADVADNESIFARRAELEDAHARLRLARLEMLCEVGSFEAVLTDGPRVVASDPWNEPAHRALAKAHYASGDQVAALQVLGDLQVGLRRDLGLDLGPDSQLLRAQILRQEPVLDRVPSAGVAVSVRASRLAERITELPASTRRLLWGAALSTAELDTARLGRALGLDGPTMASALAPALTAGILHRDDAVRFSSSRAREIVAESIPAAQALELHRRLGEVWARGGSADHMQRAAEHLAAAASLDAVTARRAVELDRRLISEAQSRGQCADAVRHARRALASAAHAASPGESPLNHAELWFSLAESCRRAGDLTAAMSAYRTAAETPDLAPDLQRRVALAFEQCSLHARRHREGTNDTAIELLERALTTATAGGSEQVELRASLAQALRFAGRGERARELAQAAVAQARQAADPEWCARVLLRCVAVMDPVTESSVRYALAQEAAMICRANNADEGELDALSAWVPEIMRAGELAEAEEVIGRVESLAEVQNNLVHRCHVPMWRAALALAAGRYDEAEVLIEDFRVLGEQDGNPSTARIHGFQTILLALGRREPERAAEVVAGFATDQAFEPWRATRLAVAHALDDREEVRRILVPWSARRFAMSRPFSDVATFCACLIAEAVAAQGDESARRRLAELVRPGVGQRQVLGVGAAMLDDAARPLDLLLGGAPETPLPR